MASQIRITPQELRDAAATLKDKRTLILETVDMIKATVERTTANWEGAAQSQFVLNFDEMLPMLRDDFPSVIEGLESMMIGAADALEGTDDELAKAFNSQG